MKHTLDELLDIVYRYYPRGRGTNDAPDASRIQETEEHVRLVAARQKAATDERWPSLLRRIQEHFPAAPLVNQSLHLPTGRYDACYSLTISPPKSSPPRSFERHHLWFQVSLLAPYYIVFSSSFTEREIMKPPSALRFVLHGVPLHVPGGTDLSGLVSNPDDESLKNVSVRRREFIHTFDLSPDERPYADWIAREIEATFGCERMPPEVGTVLVPDVATDSRRLGEVRLYDCLFSDNHPWVMPSVPDTGAPVLEIDANRLTDKGIAVLTVSAALYYILCIVLPKGDRGMHLRMDTDGVLRKEDLLKTLAAWIRPHIESPRNPRALAAKGELDAAVRDLEALIAAWDGDGAPPDAMVAWAASILASRLREDAASTAHRAGDA